MWANERAGGLCKQSDTRTHLHSDYKLHKNISGGSVCACVYRGEDSVRWQSHQHVKNIWEKNKKVGGKQTLREKCALWICTKVGFLCLLCCSPFTQCVPPFTLNTVCVHLCVCRAVQPLVEGKRHSTLPAWQTPPCVCHAARLLCGNVYVHYEACLHACVCLCVVFACVHVPVQCEHGRLEVSLVLMAVWLYSAR